MEELLKRIKDSTEELELITELLKKYKDIKIVGDKLFQKKLEDGIINNFRRASIDQLKMMKKGRYYFKYYDKEDIDKLIDITIKNRIRKDKLNKLKES